MMTILNNLKVNDKFYYNGQEYKAIKPMNKDTGEVRCVNVATNKKVWLDYLTKVEI